MRIVAFLFRLRRHSVAKHRITAHTWLGVFTFDLLGVKINFRLVTTATTLSSTHGYVMFVALHQSTAASTRKCGSLPDLGWVEIAVGYADGPSYPGLSHHRNHFSAMLASELVV